MFNNRYCNYSYLHKANYSLPDLCNDSYMEDLGQRIKRLREAAGLSQQQLGEKVGVSRIAVRKWEIGQTSNLKLDNLMSLCRLFRVTPEYLIYGKKPGKTIKNNETSISDSNIDDPNMEVFATSDEELKVLMRLVMQSPKKGRPYIKRSIDVVTELSTEEGNKEETKKKEERESNK